VTEPEAPRHLFGSDPGRSCIDSGLGHVGSGLGVFYFCTFLVGLVVYSRSGNWWPAIAVLLLTTASEIFRLVIISPR
jgi:hypothetical protein